MRDGVPLTESHDPFLWMDSGQEAVGAARTGTKPAQTTIDSAIAGEGFEPPTFGLGVEFLICLYCLFNRLVVRC